MQYSNSTVRKAIPGAARTVRAHQQDPACHCLTCCSFGSLPACQTVRAATASFDTCCRRSHIITKPFFVIFSLFLYFCLFSFFTSSVFPSSLPVHQKLLDTHRHTLSFYSNLAKTCDIRKPPFFSNPNQQTPTDSLIIIASLPPTRHQTKRRQIIPPTCVSSRQSPSPWPLPPWPPFLLLPTPP